MNKRTLTIFLLLPFTFFACNSQSIDSCDGSEGTLTHSDIEITGIETTSLLNRISSSSDLVAIDPFNGSEYSNLIIELQLSWIEEQHLFRAPNNIIQSMLDWFVSPLRACSFAPYYEQYLPNVSSIDIYSDSDFNEDFPAGSNLAMVFADAGAVDDYGWTLFEAAVNENFITARSYLLEPARREGALVATPRTPGVHTFTILITLDDGRAFEVRSEEVLLSGL